MGNDVNVDPVNAMIRLMSLIEKSNASEDQKKEILALAEVVGGYDSLTGLVNRTYLNMGLPREIARAERYGHNLSVIMGDVDNFKSYNDTYGHQQGDVALKHVARLLQADRRPSDIVGRYGGEEFLMVLPETDLRGAEKVADDIAKKVRTSKIKDYAGPENKKNEKYFGNKGVQDITISLGVTAFPEPTNDVNLLIEHADRALYVAKAAGRNGFRVYNF